MEKLLYFKLYLANRYYRTNYIPDVQLVSFVEYTDLFVNDFKLKRE